MLVKGAEQNMKKSKLFTRWSCGCVSLVPPTADNRYVVVDACAGDGYTPCFFWRDMSDKTAEPLDVEEEAAMIRKLGVHIGHGHQWLQLKALLGLPEA